LRSWLVNWIYDLCNSDEDIDSLHTDLCNLVSWSDDCCAFIVDNRQAKHMDYNDMHSCYIICRLDYENTTKEDLKVIVNDNFYGRSAILRYAPENY